uniref:Uncharacterized protein n=1 Tax=viral metagenome TaxID=1070528 RepID=A0A6M3JDM8_9ZZZZ
MAIRWDERTPGGLYIPDSIFSELLKNSRKTGVTPTRIDSDTPTWDTWDTWDKRNPTGLIIPGDSTLPVIRATKPTPKSPQYGDIAIPSPNQNLDINEMGGFTIDPTINNNGMGGFTIDPTINNNAITPKPPQYGDYVTPSPNQNLDITGGTGGGNGGGTSGGYQTGTGFQYDYTPIKDILGRTTGSIYNPKPSGISTLQQSLINKGVSAYDTMAEQDPFQYGQSIQDMAKRLGTYNPQAIQEWAETPVEWTPEQIKNTYSGMFSDLGREEELAQQNILNELKSRGLGRSGQIETSLGNLAEQYGRQRSNIITDVLGQLLPEQEKLSQSRMGLGMQGYQTAADLMTSATTMEQQQEAVNLTRKQQAIDQLGQVMGVNVAERGMDIQEKEMKIRRDIDTKQAEISEKDVEARNAISSGNLELAEYAFNEQQRLNEEYYNMQSQAQQFSQKYSIETLKKSFLDTMVATYGMEMTDASRIWSTVFGALEEGAS